MQTILRSFMLIILVACIIQTQAQNKVRFSQIDAPFYYMGDKEMKPRADYSRIVICFDSNSDLSEISSEIQSSFQNLKKETQYDEYHATVFQNTANLNKGEVKRLLKDLQRYTSVKSVTPYYIMDASSLFFFDLLNYKAKATTSKEQVQKLLDKHQVEWLEKYESPYPGGISIARVAKGKSIFKIARKLNASGLFEYVYPMSNRTVSEDYTPNDPEYIDQWHLKQDNDADIDAPEAWDLTTGNSNLVIAIQELDGFDLTHPDLSPNIVQPYNAFLDVNDAQYLDNAHTHGTRVMGCSNAVGNNNLGVTGVAFNLKVMPIILTDASSNNVNSITLQRAADHIIANGNVVCINNSWSGSSPDAAEDDQFQRMINLSRGGLGAVVVGSTGNYSNQQIRYPACYKNVVGVGRTTQADFRYSSSNWHDSVDVSAPGSSILTTDIVGAIGATGDYTTASGTSFSTPITAGVIGLMASINASLTGKELKDYIEQSCEKVGNYPYYPHVGRPNGIWDSELGYGRVNALHALLLADDSAPSNDLCGDAQALNQVTATQFCFQNASLNGATQSEELLLCAGSTSTLALDAWFEFTAIATTMEISANPSGSGLDPVIAVYESCGGTLVDCVDAADGEGFAETLELTGLTVNDTYYIQVYDYSPDGSYPSSFNFDVCAYVPGATCSPPNALAVNSTNASSADLGWNPTSGGSAYEIALRPSGVSDWTVFPSVVNFIEADELLCNTTYQWRVRAVCSNGVVSDWSNSSNFSTLDCTDCLVPYDLTATSITTTSADLSWEATPPVCVIDGFDGEIFEGTGTNGTSIDSWGDLGVNNFSVSGLQANTTYTYRVRQDCDCGILGRSIYVYHTFTTPASNNFIDLIPLEPISNLFVNGTSVDVTASLMNDEVSNAGSFELAYYLSSSPYFNSFDFKIGSTNISSVDGGLTKTETFDVDLCTLSLPDGVYYLGFYVDNLQSVDETKEANNFWFWPDKPITLNCNAPTQFVLNLSTFGNTGATVSGGGTYNAGSIATYQAFPAAGWEFVNWQENGVEISTSASDFIVMDSDKNLVAHFASLTGVSDVDPQVSFSLSPNPTTGSLTIELTEELKGAICEMYNMNGQLVASYTLEKTTNPISFEAASGIYFVQIQHPNYQFEKELLLKH